MLRVRTMLIMEPRTSSNLLINCPEGTTVSTSRGLIDLA